MGSWQLVAHRGLYEIGGRSAKTEGAKDGGEQEPVRFPGGGLEVESGNVKLQSAKTMTLKSSVHTEAPRAGQHTS